VLSKRSLLLAGHATSLALESEFWTVLEAMAAAQAISLPALLVKIDAGRGSASLASACRVAALQWGMGPEGRALEGGAISGSD
jgi:predicted DNA-binding ribbon-helix-helix protein